MTKSSIYSQRISRLQKALKQEGVDHFYVKNSVDLLYLTGMSISLGYLYLSEKTGRLFVDGRYFEVAKKNSPVPVEELSAENMSAFLKGGKKLGFDKAQLGYADFLELKKVARKAKVKLVAKEGLVSSLRIIKDPGEIKKMQKSAQLGYQGYEYIKRKLKPGVTERELVRELEIYCLKQGAQGLSFDPIIAFGKNSALPHYRPGNVKLKANDIALLDLGVMLDGYASDMTRVVFVGKPDPVLQKLHEVNKAAQRVALSLCRPGVALQEIDKAARRVMKSADVEELFVHSLGHGIGLEVHESPRISIKGGDRNRKLEKGMCITIEPGLYLPGKGGVRYEDTIVITEKGYTNFYPEK